MSRLETFTVPAGTVWGGKYVQQARAWLVAVGGGYPLTCARCSEPIPNSHALALGHVWSRLAWPEYTWHVDNWQPEHRRCSNQSHGESHGQLADRASSTVTRAMVETELSARFSLRSGAGEVPPLKISPQGKDAGQGTVSVNESGGIASKKTGDDLKAATPDWGGFLRSAAGVLPARILDVPRDAGVPRLITPLPATVAGSYGGEHIAWAERVHGVRLRWWQCLAAYLQLAHDAEGRLVFRSIIDSAPRRNGKSVRLRLQAMDRLSNAHRYGEPQTVMHTGKDMAIVREIQRGAWRWCDENEWVVSRANGKEAIETPDGEHRWLARAQDAVYGYDVTYGLVDEAWGVKPETISEGLEPATLERISPQMHLTSTAHTRASSLMLRRMRAAMAGSKGTLLMLWGADPDAATDDRSAWRSASGHWSDDRAEMMEDKYLEALEAERNPSPDNLNPLEGFRAQYMNIWPLEGSTYSGDELVSREALDGMAALVPTFAPDATAVEQWPGSRGVAVVEGWRVGDKVHMHAYLCDTLSDAARAVSGRRVTVGASLASAMVWRDNGCVVTPGRGTVAEAAKIWQGMLGQPLSLSGDVLPGQLAAVRTMATAEGHRVTSVTRADAVKAASWVLEPLSTAGAGVMVF